MVLVKVTPIKQPTPVSSGNLDNQSKAIIWQNKSSFVPGLLPMKWKEIYVLLYKQATLLMLNKLYNYILLFFRCWLENLVGLCVKPFNLYILI